MSSGVEVIVLAPMLAPLLAQALTGLGAAALGASVAKAGEAAARAAGEAFNQLHNEYEDALVAMRENAAISQREARERTDAELAAAQGASGLAALTLRKAGGGTVARMLTAGIARLEQRLAGMDPRPPDVARRLAELAAALHSGGAEAELFQQYLALCRELEQAPPPETAAEAGGTEPPALARLRQVRALLEAPLFEIAGGAECRSELGAKLAEIERLAATQPRLALEMAEELLRRAEREAERLLDEQAGRDRQAADAREQALQFFACLAAVEGQASLPELAARAGALRARAAAELAELDGAAFYTRLRELLGSARELFSEAERQLAAGMLKAVISANVRDVLQGMGYAVSEPEADSAGGERMLAALSDRAGIEVSLTAEGQVRSEMVAFGTLNAEELKQQEEHVCQVVDQLVAELRRRRFEVRERFRTHYAEGEQPRRVERPQRRAAPRKAAGPQRKTLGGDE